MPIPRQVNRDFFKKWSPEMAYVLGFFAADGSMYETKRGGYYIEFESIDRLLLVSVRKVMNSHHKISFRQRGDHIAYRIQIGSVDIFKDLLKLGLTPSKSLILKLPEIPADSFAHFVRGYFDGDGCVSMGIYNGKRVCLTRLTCGSKLFLKSLKQRFSRTMGTTGSLMNYSGAWRLQYALKDSIKLRDIMYSGEKSELIYLARKYTIFKQI